MNEPTPFAGDRAKSYDQRIVQAIPGYAVLHKLAGTILAAELLKEASLLIVGAGTGMEILEWGPEHEAWHFTASDPSPDMLAIAKQKLTTASLLERISLHEGTVDQLPEDAAFDAATLLLVLHFLATDEERAALLEQIISRLAPGAPFLISSLFGDTESTRYKKQMTWTKAWAIRQGMDPKQAEDHFSPTRKDLCVITEEHLKRLLRDAGFIDVQRFFQTAAFGAWIARAPR